MFAWPIGALLFDRLGVCTQLARDIQRTPSILVAGWARFPASERRAESQYFDEARCFPRGTANEQAMSVRIAEKLEGILAVDAAAVKDCTDGIA